MSTARTYGEACGIPRALDRIGERWALMVVRELVLGPKRFTDIRNGLPHASPNVLAQRLRELEEVGVVRKRKLPPPAASQVYELTEWGRELEDVLIALGRWGARAPAPPDGACMSLDSHLLSLTTLFDPERAGDFEGTVELHFGEHVFNVAVAGGRIAVARGEASSPDAVVEGEPGTFLAISHGRLELDDALGAGELSVTGDRDVLARFVTLFTLPAPAQVPSAVGAA
jgi:DNA-binding HxlR family transcriptional regulator/putative sterol carrier protein